MQRRDRGFEDGKCRPRVTGLEKLEGQLGQAKDPAKLDFASLGAGLRQVYAKHLGEQLRDGANVALRERLRLAAHPFDRLAAATAHLREGQASGVVTLTCLASFAAGWLVPRLGRFSQQYPGIELRIDTSRRLVDFAMEDVDLAIRYNLSEDNDQQRWPLMEELVLPVCSPGYLATHGSLDDCPDLSGHTLAHLSGSIRIPCSFTGLFGIKASFGRVPAWPLSPFGTVAHVGPMTRSVADAALMLNVLSLPDARDWHALPHDPRDWRTGLDQGALVHRFVVVPVE